MSRLSAMMQAARTGTSSSHTACSDVHGRINHLASLASVSPRTSRSDHSTLQSTQPIFSETKLMFHCEVTSREYLEGSTAGEKSCVDSPTRSLEARQFGSVRHGRHARPSDAVTPGTSGQPPPWWSPPRGRSAQCQAKRQGGEQQKSCHLLLPWCVSENPLGTCNSLLYAISHCLAWHVTQAEGASSRLAALLNAAPTAVGVRIGMANDWGSPTGFTYTLSFVSEEDVQVRAHPCQSADSHTPTSRRLCWQADDERLDLEGGATRYLERKALWAGEGGLLGATVDVDEDYNLVVTRKDKGGGTSTPSR